jgi:hypothetical protein
MRRIVLTLALAAVLVPVCASGASARVVDVPTRLSAAIPKAHDSGLVVLLPSRMNLDVSSGTRIFAEGEGEAQDAEYSLSLSGARDCDGANACFLAEFQGEKGKTLGFRTNVALALGMRGAYRGLSCGGSCSPPSIQWVQKGVRYEIQAKALGGRAGFVRMANSAIRNGNRK